MPNAFLLLQVSGEREEIIRQRGTHHVLVDREFGCLKSVLGVGKFAIARKFQSVRSILRQALVFPLILSQGAWGSIPCESGVGPLFSFTDVGNLV